MKNKKNKNKQAANNKNNSVMISIRRNFKNAPLLDQVIDELLSKGYTRSQIWEIFKFFRDTPNGAPQLNRKIKEIKTKRIRDANINRIKAIARYKKVAGNNVVRNNNTNIRGGGRGSSNSGPGGVLVLGLPNKTPKLANSRVKNLRNELRKIRSAVTG